MNYRTKRKKKKKDETKETGRGKKRNKPYNFVPILKHNINSYLTLDKRSKREEKKKKIRKPVWGSMVIFI